MSKWSDEFIATYQDTAKIKRVTEELKKANRKCEDNAKRVFKGGDVNARR